MSGSESFHQQVARKLIEQLKQGVAPWQKPWDAGEPGAFLPINPDTGKRYRGINALLLMAQQRADQRWMTYKQAISLGAQVRRGEKGTAIQYWKFTDLKNRLDEKGKPILDSKGQPVKIEVRLERPRVFFATVFNAEQIDNLPLLERKPVPWSVIERAEQILQLSNATIRHIGDRAYYQPATDSINLPEKHRFDSADKYYATALHELGHWTGHHSRLARDLNHPFGSEGYAKEELRAEIASMILGDELGIGHDPAQHVAYVGAWIRALQDDPLEIFRAAADAEKIYSYVLGLEQKQVQEQTAEQQMDASTMYHYASQSATANDTQTDKIAENKKSENVEKTFLAVPYVQKDQAKALGARWDRQQQSWYVQSGLDKAPFSQWLPDSAMPETKVQTKQAVKQVERTSAEEEIRQYLVVPYGERYAAKAAGAFWDKQAKSWCAGPEADREKLKRWLPKNHASQQDPAMNPREEFAEALRSVGCIVTGEHPLMDGKKHRISVEGDKKGEKAGFYVAYLDGHPAGYVKNNRTSIEVKWKSKGYHLSSEQKAQILAETAKKQQLRQEEQERQYAQAAQDIIKKMVDFVPTIIAPTPYLLAKGIEPQLDIFTDREGQKTYVPATDAKGKLWTMQIIHADGSKRFAKNSRKEGCFHAIGGLQALAEAPALVIAEGYATAASVSEALGYSVVAAFDAGNLAPVAKALQAKFPDKPIVIAGDNDQYLEITQGINPGKSKAQEAAQAVGGKVMLPILTPQEKLQASTSKSFTDFNDLANKSEFGRRSVERQVQFFVDKVIQEHKGTLQQPPKMQRQERQRQGIAIGC